MSYDVYLESPVCDKCGHRGEEPDLPDPTYNLSPIFDLALTGETFPNSDINEACVVLFKSQTDRPRGLRVLSGRKATDTESQLRRAVETLKDPEKQAAFKALEPENGWGSLSGAILVMEKLLRAAIEYPSNIWKIQ
jgi:hypothetical protein